MGVFLRICHLSQVTKSSSPFVYKDCTSKMTCHKPRPPPHAYLQKTGPNLRETGSYLLKIDFYLHEIAELKNARRARAQLAYFNAKHLVISEFFSTFVPERCLCRGILS